MDVVRSIDSHYDTDLIKVHDALSSVVRTPFPARGKMLIDESLTTVGIWSIRLESGHRPPESLPQNIACLRKPFVADGWCSLVAHPDIPEGSVS
jgi:hypothetical protein